MPYVFTDEVGDNDLLIPASTLWTPGPAAPNGDGSYKHNNNASAQAWVPDPTGLYIPGPTGTQFITVEMYRYHTDGGVSTSHTDAWLVSHGSNPWSSTTMNWAVWHDLYGSSYDNVGFRVFDTNGAALITTSFNYNGTGYANTWHHHAFTMERQGNSLWLSAWYNGSLLVNRSLGTGGTGIPRMLANSVTRLRLYNGSSGNLTTINGAMAKIAIYNRALTQAEIDQHVAAMTYF